MGHLLQFPVESIVFLLCSLGNDYCGSLSGFTHSFLLSIFLDHPIDLVLGGGNLWPHITELETRLDFENYQKILIRAYYQKQKKKLKQFVSYHLEQ